jgi:GWxTD domain-containing protein
MTFLLNWVQTASAKALGWALLHSLWEGAAIALALAIVLGIARSSRVRYASACLAMLALLASFGVTLYRLMPQETGGPVALGVLSLAPRPSPDDLPVSNIGTPWDASDLLPWLAPLWLAGVLLFQLRCVAAWMAAGRVRRIGVCAVPDAWVERLNSLRARMRMTRPVTLLESCFAEVPVVIGHLRPVILMPVGLLAAMPVAQVESILLHELAHIQRADYLVNLMQTLVEGLLFYHPAVWWISRVIRTERENCCDDLVVQTSGDAHEYAAALTSLAENRWAMREAAMAATGGNLVNRIRRLLSQPEDPHTAIAPALSAGVLIVTCGIALAAWQSPQQGSPRMVPVIPGPPVPLVEPLVQAQATPAASQPAAQTPAKDRKAQTEALENLREILQKIEGGRRGPSMMLAQDNANPLASPALSPYRKWLNEEAAYIITDQERAAFKALRTDDERNMFIEQFWLRRDPTPGTPQNEFRDEHYRRIAYANDRFGDKKLPGWKTDRGRIYITYGPPDEIESHPSGGTYTRPPEQGGGQTNTYPFEQWMYRYIEGIGKNVILEFLDKTMSGEYQMTMDPAEKDPLLFVPRAGITVFRSLGAGPQAVVEITGNQRMAVTIPIAFEAGQYLISTSTVSTDGKTNLGNTQTLANSCKVAPRDSACLKDSLRTVGTVEVPSGSYTLTAKIKDTASTTEKTYVVNFSVELYPRILH